MARDRFQNGWVEETGKKAKKWRGHYYVYVKSAADSVVRRHQVVSLGLKSEMRKGEAEKKLREIIEREAGTVTARPDAKVTFQWFWENRFLPLQVGWRDSTRSAVVYTMNTHVLRTFGDVSLEDLRRFDLQTYLNTLAKTYSKSLVVKARTWMRSVLEEAVEQEYLVKNPARKLTMPPTRPTCKRFLTKDEYHRLLATLPRRDQLILRLFVLCALRPGELFALRWKCFDGSSLRIEEAVYARKLGEPKTEGSAATVALPKSLAADLTSWYVESECPDPDKFIFPSKVGKPIDGHNYLRRDVLKPAAASVGIKGVTFQCLRRTFATHFHRIGTVKDQQAQMRHANAQTTMNIYTQTLSASLQESMESFDQEMSGLNDQGATANFKKGFEHK